MPSPFLTAEWAWLAMLNYEIDPEVLRPHVPAGTELDSHDGRTYASMVGFHFMHARLHGREIPFHSTFEEVNLRFYVRRTVGGEVRRGVVFIKEIVPRRAIAWTARLLYNENYVAMPMQHRNGKYGATRKAAYEWTFNKRVHSLSVRTEGDAPPVATNSLEEFITEHYWGYVRGHLGGTHEYQVEHPRWRVWPAREAALTCDVPALYGKAFAPFLTSTPASAFLAEGSEVAVFPAVRI